MNEVKAKKHLGQHFLNDKNICQKISNSLVDTNNYNKILEIGPGTGALTQHLIHKDEYETYVMDIDKESIAFLKSNFKELNGRIYYQDFLTFNPFDIFQNNKFAVIGNFPYNISTQILFKVLSHKNQIPEVVGMFQKEVAERIAEKHGSKSYGILSVLLQAFYDIEYLFTVSEKVFLPRPKVKSGVIRLLRNERKKVLCGDDFFIQIVKSAFNQRRKTLRNSLKQILNTKNENFNDGILSKRPEQISVEEFISLSNKIFYLN